MEIRYNVTGAKRKELVKVIADTTGARAEYKFMPTCNYEIDYFTVTKDGTLLFDDRADSEEVERVLESSPPLALNVSRRTALSNPLGKKPKKRKKSPTARHRANLWDLQWRFRSTRWRWATSRSCWKPKEI